MNIKPKVDELILPGFLKDINLSKLIFPSFKYAVIENVRTVKDN